MARKTQKQTAAPHYTTDKATEDRVNVGMAARGYRYRLAPQSGRFPPLYAKLAEQVQSLERDYPNEKFTVTEIS